MPTPLRFAIIGCGVISDWHAQSIRALEGVELIGATDVYAPSLERFTARYGIHAYPNQEALLADPAVDVVCVCTPSGLHAPVAIAAADAGKHVVLEKPMALTHEQCAAVIKAVDRNGIKLEVISQNRLSDTVNYVRDAIAAERFGRIVCADVYMKYYRSPSYYASGSWRGTWAMDGGGALMNQGIHGVDLIQYLCGPVKSVFAHAHTLVHKIEVEDTATAVVTYESGALGIIQGTTSVYPGYERRIEVCGSRGSVHMINSNIVEWTVEGEQTPADLPTTHIVSSTASDPTAMTIEGHKRQIADLADAVRNNRRPAVTERDGKQPVDIILAIYESERTGREVFL